MRRALKTDDSSTAAATIRSHREVDRLPRQRQRLLPQPGRAFGRLRRRHLQRGQLGSERAACLVILQLRRRRLRGLFGNAAVLPLRRVHGQRDGDAEGQHVGVGTAALAVRELEAPVRSAFGGGDRDLGLGQLGAAALRRQRAQQRGIVRERRGQDHAVALVIRRLRQDLPRGVGIVLVDHVGDQLRPQPRRRAGRAQFQRGAEVGVRLAIKVRCVDQHEAQRLFAGQLAGLRVDAKAQLLDRAQHLVPHFGADVGLVVEHARHRGPGHTGQGGDIVDGRFAHCPESLCPMPLRRNVAINRRLGKPRAPNWKRFRATAG